MTKIYEGLSHNERLDKLKSECRSTDKKMIQVHFNQDDLAEMKSRLSEHLIKKDEITDEMKEQASAFKKLIKAEAKAIKGLLSYIRDGFEYQEQEVYEFDDQENGVMKTYNCEGEQISERPLLPKERAKPTANA